MLSKEKAVKNIIDNIHEESRIKFNCINYQYVAGRLEDELAKNYTLPSPKKNNNKRTADRIRNLQILNDVILGADYKDLRLKYKITSTAGIATIAKRTACSLDIEISNLIIEERLPPKRVINWYGVHLADLIKNELKKLNGGI